MPIKKTPLSYSFFNMATIFAEKRLSAKLLLNYKPPNYKKEFKIYPCIVIFDHYELKMSN
jgi:hypothetical protein